MTVNLSLHADVLINKYLKIPVEDFLSRPRKDLRGEIIDVGYHLYNKRESKLEDYENLRILSSILEWIHSGSLIIDDIQDNSKERRGDDCLHIKFGLPCALNAANWMYFEALKKFNTTTLNEKQKFRMINLSLEIMTFAHEGQAIDIMTDVKTLSREDIYNIGQNNQDLKSGMLFSLALALGAITADEDVDLSRTNELGILIGRSLQRFDDLGNLDTSNHSKKSLEDLVLGRPTWPWMYVAKYMEEDDLKEFKDSVVELPDVEKLNLFLQKTNLKNQALMYAHHLHNEIYYNLTAPFPGSLQIEGIEKLKNILKRISNAYIK